METYWRTLCLDNRIPARGQVDPRGLQGALENTFIVERISPRLAKIRVAGSHFFDLMGMEVSGMPLSSLFSPEAREELGTALAQVFDRPAILTATLEGEKRFACPELSGRMVLLPLRSDMGDVTRAMGCLVTQGGIGRAPRRFGLQGLSTRPALSGGAARHVGTRTEALLPRSAPQPHQFAESRVPFNRGPGDGRRPNLRLVVSNDT